MSCYLLCRTGALPFSWRGPAWSPRVVPWVGSMRRGIGGRLPVPVPAVSAAVPTPWGRTPLGVTRAAGDGLPERARFFAMVDPPLEDRLRHGAEQVHCQASGCRRGLVHPSAEWSDGGAQGRGVRRGSPLGGRLIR